MEKRSTVPPASAILMTAASPARPPPTTMIFGVAIASFQEELSAFSYQIKTPLEVRDGGVGVHGADERPDAGDSHAGEQDAEGETDPGKTAARGFSGDDAPLGGEEPDAIGEVPADGDHCDGVDGGDPGIGEFVLHFVECVVRILGQADAHEALGRYVIGDVGEGN